jgi:glycine/sarcosine N-methyltransferase
MSQDRYEGFAERYDQFFETSDERDSGRIGFFRQLFLQHKTRSLLDCACGTGRDLLMFQALGLDVWGSDISESILIQARKNLAQYHLDIPLSRVDYLELNRHYDRRFDAVVCLSTAILETPHEDNVLRAFKNMYDVLNKGGILVLSQGLTDKQWQNKPRFIPAVNTREFSRVFVIDYFEQGARYNILDIFHTDKLCDFKVWSIDFAHILLKDDLERLLKLSGFSRIDFFGTYSFELYAKETSDHLICIATK